MRVLQSWYNVGVVYVAVQVTGSDPTFSNYIDRVQSGVFSSRSSSTSSNNVDTNGFVHDFVPLLGYPEEFQTILVVQQPEDLSEQLFKQILSISVREQCTRKSF